jgi:hypothetical protein
MRPPVWHPPVERSSAAHAIIKRIRQAKLLVVLRQDRYELCSNPLQQELAALSMARPRRPSAGSPPTNWRWRRSCKPIPVCQMRSVKPRRGIVAGRWCSIASIAAPLPSAKAGWWRFANA